MTSNQNNGLNGNPRISRQSVRRNKKWKPRLLTNVGQTNLFGLSSLPPRILCVEIADQVLRFVYLERNGKHCHAREKGTVAFSFNDSVSGALQNSVNEILGLLRSVPQKAFLSVSLSQVVIHQIILPKMSARETKEIIPCEIEKIPDFYEKDFEFIYKSYPLSSYKNKIVFAVIPRDSLHYIIQEMNRTEIPFSSLEITPLNLIDIPSLIKATHHSEVVLTVHNNHTFIQIVENKEYKQLYKVAQGSEYLSSADLKEQAFLGWVAEIRRVVKSYMMENKSIYIERIWLVWDRDLISDLDVQIEHELNVRVEALDVFGIFPIKENFARPISPIYALAMVPLLIHLKGIKAQFSLNYFLMKFHVKEYLVKAVLTVAVIIGVFSIISGVLSQNIHRETKILSGDIAALRKEIDGVNEARKNLDVFYEVYHESYNRLLAQATYIQEINRVSWSEVLSVIAYELPPDLSLVSFDFKGSGSALIKGDALTMESIAEMIRRVDDSAILEKAEFDYLREKTQGEEKTFNFGILARLKRK